jgi:hypothetical protein
MGRSLIPLEVIASDVSADLGDSKGKYKYKLTRYLLDGYRKLHTFIDQDFDVKTAVLEYDNVVVLPDDFIYETKVGIRNENGCIAILTLDKSIQARKLSDSQCSSFVNSVWNGEYEGDGYYFYNAFRGGESLGELYGYGRGVINSGFYNLDRKSGEIYIGSHVPVGCEIVVEYKSDGVSNGLKLVPIEMKEALEFYAKFKWYADKNITQSQVNKNYYEEEYYRIKRLYNFRSALYMSSKINSFFSPSNY